MTTNRKARREFLKTSLSTAAAAAAAPWPARAHVIEEPQAAPAQPAARPRIRFAAIGLNHGHINGQCEAVIRGGGELVSFFANSENLRTAAGAAQDIEVILGAQ